jgi:hypothetical protein
MLLEGFCLLLTRRGKCEEAKESYYGKARSARLAQKILEEAERQSQIGGITRAALFTESRLSKLRESATRSREEEAQSALAYRDALDLVAKKQSELYTVRLPRVLDEVQRLVEERTDRVRVELLDMTVRSKVRKKNENEPLVRD